jgi:cation:H+ antiporter
MLLTVCLFIAGIVLLTAGAEFFVRGSSLLARRMGVAPLVVGLTVVAFGTSAPELFVSVKSALMSVPGIAVGNVIGSNIANIALILAGSALIMPLTVHRQIVKRDMPFLIVFSAVLCLLLLDRSLSRWDSLLLLLLFGGYLFATVSFAKRESADRRGAAQAPKERGSGLPLIFLMIAFGLGGLLYGSQLMVDAGVTLARYCGVSDTIIGISIVAVGTSLPELAASLMAAFKKESDIAVGNVVGSCIFNIGMVLGCAGGLSPFAVPELKYVDLGVMFALSLVLLPFLKSGFTLNRIEGAILLLAYAGYMFYLWS